MLCLHADGTVEENEQSKIRYHASKILFWLRQNMKEKCLPKQSVPNFPNLYSTFECCVMIQE